MLMKKQKHMTLRKSPHYFASHGYFELRIKVPLVLRLEEVQEVVKALVAIEADDLAGELEELIEQAPTPPKVEE
jgi:hypothetical protein